MKTQERRGNSNLENGEQAAFWMLFKKMCLDELLTGGIRERGKIAEHSKRGGWCENKNTQHALWDITGYVE